MPVKYDIDLLDAVRKEQGLNYQELAELAGLSAIAIYNLFNPNRGRDIKTPRKRKGNIEKIAAALKVDMGKVTWVT